MKFFLLRHKYKKFNIHYNKTNTALHEDKKKIEKYNTVKHNP